jgi:hypothetical protein
MFYAQIASLEAATLALKHEYPAKRNLVAGRGRLR